MKYQDMYLTNEYTAPNPQKHPPSSSSSSEQSSDASTSSFQNFRIYSDGTQAPRDRNAYGLLLHPTREGNKYVRVGIWASVAGDGVGTRYFEQFENVEVEII